MRSSQRYWLLLGALMAAPHLAAATDIDKTYRRTTTDGAAVLLHHYASWDRQCRPTGDVIITVVSQPVGGTLDMRHETKTDAGQERVGAASCVGVAMPSVGVYYVPRPGFKGTDRFQLEIRYGRGSPVIDEGVIEVR